MVHPFFRSCESLSYHLSSHGGICTGASRSIGYLKGDGKCFGTAIGLAERIQSRECATTFERRRAPVTS